MRPRISASRSAARRPFSREASSVSASPWNGASDLDPASLHRVVAALTGARHVLALTGSGISAESGIPTFREAQTGLWATYDPAELATPEAFERAPKRVWDWYALRRAKVSEARPNPGHHAIAEMERLVPDFTLVTQNVDGLHQRAGSTRVIELHGNLARVRCSSEQKVIERWREDGSGPPRCPDCGALLRPDVVWFGELLPRHALTEAERAATRCDVLFAIGTSSLVYPAAALPGVAHGAGALIVVVNPEATDAACLPGAVHLAGQAGSILPAIVEELRLRG